MTNDIRLGWRAMLPIVARELRVAAKRRVTYRLRWIVALLGGFGVLAAAEVSGYSVAAGQFVFWAVSAVMMLICGAAGLLLTADSISREKREQTLGLLFLTRLTAADVVLGKLAVGALSGGAVAFAGLPFLAFSLCLGGVTAREFWVMSASLLLLLAVSLTFGVFISTLFRHEGAIAAVFCLVMVGPLALTPLAVLKFHAIPPWLAIANPLFPTLTLMDDGKYFSSALAMRAAALQAAAIPAMLALAFVVLPWTLRAGGARSQMKLKNPLRRLAGKARPFDGNPIYMFSRRQGHATALFLLCAGLYFVVGFAAPTVAEAEITFVLLMAILPKFFVLWHASGVMAAERRSGFLETLLTTPMTGAEVLRGKMSAIKRQVAPALLFALVALWATSTKWWGANGEITIGATLVLAAMITLLVDVHSIGWVGLWQGLMARDRRRALMWAAGWGLLAPWLPAFTALATIAWLFDAPMWMNHPENIVSLALVSANVVSFAIACFAMARVHEKFRATATQTWSTRGRSAARA